MRARTLFVSIPLLVLAVIAAPEAQQPAPDAGPTQLPVRRGILYKSGVGYFEHLGTVTGSTDVAIQFTSGPLNDVLKSLTAIDPNSHASLTPSSRRSRSSSLRAAATRSSRACTARARVSSRRRQPERSTGVVGRAARAGQAHGRQPYWKAPRGPTTGRSGARGSCSYSMSPVRPHPFG